MAIINGDANNNTLNGTGDADTISGLGGDDVLNGLLGNDTVLGGDGNDVLTDGISGDTQGLDQLDGGAGDDILIVASANIGESYDGGAGVDMIDFSLDTVAIPNIVLGATFQHFGANFSNFENAIGSNFVNDITGSADDNFIDGRDGNDTLLGGAGDDFLIGGGGNDVINGQAGFDTVSYTDRAVGFQFNLNEVVSSAIAQDSSETDELRSIDNILGSNFADVLNVDAQFIGDDGSGFNQFRGGGGNDTINGNGETRIDYGDADGAVRVDLNAGQQTQITASNVGTDNFNGVQSVNGSRFDDVLLGSEGNEFESFRGQAGNDFIDGRGGDNDRADYRNSPGGVEVDLAARTGLDGFGTLDFLFNIEDVRGSSFADTLSGDAKANTFRGRGGDDTFNGRGSLRDTADYRLDATAAITANLGSVATVTGDASVGTDTLNEVERVIGSGFNDTFTADAAFNNGDADTDNPERAQFNIFRGGAGDDVINGNGVTRVEYTDAQDGVRVSLADGTGRGLSIPGDPAGVGQDTLSGVFQIRGSAFNDLLIGSNLDPAAGFESFIGEAGNDSIAGGLGDDQASYITSPGGVNANLNTGSATDGFGGIDTLTGIEALEGSNFDDVLIGSTDDNLFETRDGDDFVNGQGGDDIISYNDEQGGTIIDLRGEEARKASGGVDTLLSIEGAIGSRFGDSILGSGFANGIEGGGGNDRIAGLAGDDQIAGESGNDVLFGNSGADELDGGDGDDKLVGGFGVDIMRGGAGDDTYIVDDNNDVVIELAGEGVDTMIISNTVQNIGAPANVEIIILDFGPGQVASLNGLANFNDQLFGSDSNDTLRGNSGNDFLRGGGGEDNLFGEVGNDTLRGDGGDDDLDGGDGADLVIGGAGFDDVSGGAGNDRLNGQSGDDLLVGGAGSDLIIGGSGNDAMHGAEQALQDGVRDRFSFGVDSGQDVIANFEVGIDEIDFRLLNAQSGRFPTFAAVQAAMTDVNGNARIQITQDDFIDVFGVASADLSAGDFFLFDLPG